MQNLLMPRYRSISPVVLIVAVLSGGVIVWGAGQPWFPIKLSLNIPGQKAEFVSPDKKSDDDSKKVDESIKNASGYIAVYLDSDQVFYGKPDKQEKQRYIVLSDAFYYQPGVRSPIPGNIRITKVGSELHKPIDAVHINRSHIVMVEQLTEESKVTQAILKYKAE